jgi:hypothetical protein
MARSLFTVLYDAAFTNTSTGKQHNATQQLTQREIEVKNKELAEEGVEFRWIAEMPSTNSADTERDAINSIDWNA